MRGATMRLTIWLCVLVSTSVHGGGDLSLWIDNNDEQQQLLQQQQQQQQRELQTVAPSPAPTTSSARGSSAPSVLGSHPVAGGSSSPSPSVVGAPTAPTASHGTPTTASGSTNAPTGASSNGGGANGTTHNSTTQHNNHTTSPVTPTSHSATTLTAPTTPTTTSGGATSSSVPSMAPSSKSPSSTHSTNPKPTSSSSSSGGSSPHMAPVSFGSKHPSLSSFPMAPFKKVPTLAPVNGFGGDDVFDGPTPSSRHSEKPEKYIPKDDDPVAKENETPADEWQEVQETNDQLMRDKRLLIAFGTLLGASFLLLVLTAQQLLENPHGCCASLCRMTVACMCCLVRCVCFPCRAMCGNRDRRTHDLMLTERNSYTHDLELN